MLRGRCSCATSSRASASSGTQATRHATPSGTQATRRSPVSPIIPAHTQKQGGGGLLQSVLSYNSFVFCRYVNYFINSNCRRADISVFAVNRRQSRTDLKVGHYKSEPKSTVRNDCATRAWRDADYFGWAVALPMSRTTFQLPSCCSFQMLVYLPCSTVGLPSLSLERNS